MTTWGATRRGRRLRKCPDWPLRRPLCGKRSCGESSLFLEAMIRGLRGLERVPPGGMTGGSQQRGPVEKGRELIASSRPE